MDCPTCFQKIVAPQAPADGEQKLIITGTKLTDKKTFVPVTDSSVTVEKTFPVGAIIGLILFAIGASAAGYYFYGNKTSTTHQTAENLAADTNSVPEKVEKKVIAPAANDANWSLALGTNAIPDAPVVGRIHGQDFAVEHAVFSNGALMLRAGNHGALEFGAFVHFGGAQPESLAGQTINITANTNKTAKVSFRWKDASGAVQKAVFENGYTLRLEFGALEKNHLPGKIYLCTPDVEKSYLLGSFNADARKPKTKGTRK